MKRRVLSCLLSFILMFSTLSSLKIFAKDGEYQREYKVNGQITSVEEFSDKINNPQERIIKKVGKNDKSELQMTNLLLNQNQISFDATIDTGIKLEKLTVSGLLYSSYKTGDGRNSIVGDLKTNSDFKIMYFEIFNDNEEDYLMLDNVDNHTPHFKMYILDANKNIHIFEGKLPKELEQINYKDFERCDSKVDLFWSDGVFEMGTTKVLETDSDILDMMEMSSRDVKGLRSLTTWNGPKTYYRRIQTGADYVECYSLPYLEYEHSPVNSSTNPWILSFKIAEHSKVNGKRLDRSITNIFRYKNIQMSMACGENSKFYISFLQGRLIQYKNNSLSSVLVQQGKAVSAKLLQVALGVVPAGKEISDMWNLISKMSSKSQTVRLGSKDVELHMPNTVAVGYKFDNHELHKSTDYGGSKEIGHYIRFSSDLIYKASGTSNTVGGFEFDCEVWDSEKVVANIHKQISLKYTAKP